jgi:hypothetical protein
MRLLFYVLLGVGLYVAADFWERGYAQPTGSNTAPNKVPISTVANLPTCNSGNEGLRLGVTDATAPTSLATVAGGGAVHVAVYCNNTNWIVQ